MQGCNKELAFLAEEQDKVKKQDWSDHMVDPPDTRRQYEVSAVISNTTITATLRNTSLSVLNLILK